jgi:hypothetical protein
MEIVKIILACIGAYTVVTWVWDWLGFDRKYHSLPKVVPEENEKPLSIPERRVKRFELLQVVADLYAGKEVVLEGEDQQFFSDINRYLSNQKIPDKHLFVMENPLLDKIILRLGEPIIPPKELQK